MRNITNRELQLIGGGDAKEENVQVVEITGKKMNFIENWWYDKFQATGYGNSMNIEDWRKLQRAYEMANHTGQPVEVELSEVTKEIGTGIVYKEGETKYKMVVKPADCYAH